MREERDGTNMEPLFVIKSKLEVDDHKKFGYISLFRITKFGIPYIFFISLITSVFLYKGFGFHNLILFFVFWIIMIGVAIVGIYLKGERYIKKRIQTDKTGSFCSLSIWKIYEDRIVIEGEALQSKSELRYDQFYKMIESKEYYFLYLNAKQALLLRKKDIEKLSDFENFIVPKFKDKYKKLAWRRKS